ncbi:MAG: DUF5916 domain-containing protein [Myxococcota bacterium]
MFRGQVGSHRFARIRAFGVLAAALLAPLIEPSLAPDSSSGLAHAAAFGTVPTVHAVLVEEAPVIDGVLDDPIWQRAEVITDLTQVEPVQGAPPSFRTEVRILTDGDTLFVSVHAFDPEPDKIVANRMARSELFFYDDNFGINLDTFHDHRSGFFFQINPLGGRRDATFEGDLFEENWDGIWYAKARIVESGWVGEIAIPFKTLGFVEGQDDWGLNVSRRVRRFNEDDRWADPTIQRLSVNMAQAGVLTGMSVARVGIGLDVVPAISVGAVHDELRNRDKLITEPSFDAFYRVLPSVTASVTANTDFAQTEVDDTQVNLTRFALFFPEKREFFLREKGLFDFGGLENENGIPFFSRRIGLSPDLEGIRLHGGGRVTGRVGRYRIGLLDIQQDGNAGFDDTNLAVARVSATVLDESAVGMILTHGDPASEEENLLAGADVNFRSSRLIPNRSISVNGWIQQDFRGDAYGDRSSAFGASIVYPNDRVNFKLKYKEFQKGYDPALAFVNRTDVRGYEGEYRLRFRQSTGPFRMIDLQTTANFFTNRDNVPETGSFNFSPVRLTSQLDDLFEMKFIYLYDNVPRPFFITPHIGIPPREYHGYSGLAELTTSLHRPIRVKLTGSAGTFYDGWGARVSPLVEWRPSPHWLLSLEYDERQFFDYDACKGSTRGTGNCRRGFDEPFRRHTGFATRLARVRVQIAFNTEIAWSTVVQYDNFSNRISAQSRLSWIIEPGREFFLVVGQDFDATPGDLRVMTTRPVAKLRWTFRF